MVIIVIRELHEAVESLGDEDSVMGFMKAMRTSGGYRQKNSREPFFGRPLALLVPLVLGGRRDQSQGAAACLRLSVCCIFWNPGWDSASENHKTLHEKTRCAQELSTPLETAMSISFCGSRDWSAQNNLEREWPSPTGQSPPARGFCKGAFFPSTGLKGLEFKLYCDMGEWN